MLQRLSPAVKEPSLITMPTSQGVASVETIKSLASYIAAAAKWMKLIGVLSFISGVITCLTIIGAVIGWIPIWSGLSLMKAANSARQAEMTGDQATLVHTLDQLRLNFKINGIMSLISLVFTILYLVIFGAAIIASLFGAASAAGTLSTP